MRSKCKVQVILNFLYIKYVYTVYAVLNTIKCKYIPFLAATVLLGTLSVCFRPNDGEKTEAVSSSLLSNLAESKNFKAFFSKEIL